MAAQGLPPRPDRLRGGGQAFRMMSALGVTGSIPVAPTQVTALQCKGCFLGGSVADDRLLSEGSEAELARIGRGQVRSRGDLAVSGCRLWER